MADGHEKSADGWASGFGFEDGGLGDDGGWGGVLGGWSVGFESFVFSVESSGTWDCLFLFADEEIYVGFPWVFGGGVRDGTGGGVVGS